jgi:low temperature requirement protein LtrA
LYVVLVAGIIVVAVGNELVISHPSSPLHGAQLVAVAAGPALYLLGSVVLKIRVLRVRWDRRFIAAVLIVAATAVGQSLPGLALWAVLLAVLMGLAVIEGLEVRVHADAVAGGEERAAGTPMTTQG